MNYIALFKSIVSTILLFLVVAIVVCVVVKYAMVILLGTMGLIVTGLFVVAIMLFYDGYKK